MTLLDLLVRAGIGILTLFTGFRLATFAHVWTLLRRFRSDVIDANIQPLDVSSGPGARNF